MASTWDVDLVREEGRVIAEEVKALGRDMILGPTVHIARTPLWGRNFEGYGADPVPGGAHGRRVRAGGPGRRRDPVGQALHDATTSRSSSATASTKRSTLGRCTRSTFPAFKAAVKEAGVWAVMSAYNKLNGDWVRREPVPPHRDPEAKLGLQGIRHLGLGQHVQHAAAHPCWHGPRDARRRSDAPLAGPATHPGGGQRRRLAGRREGARGRRRRARSSKARSTRPVARIPACRVHGGAALRAAARGRRPGRHAPRSARPRALRPPKAPCCSRTGARRCRSTERKRAPWL